MQYVWKVKEKKTSLLIYNTGERWRGIVVSHRIFLWDKKNQSCVLEDNKIFILNVAKNSTKGL